MQKTVCSYDELLSEVSAGRPDAYYPEMLAGNTKQCYIVRDTSIKGSPVVGVAAPVGRRLKLASALGEPTHILQDWDIYIRVDGLPEDHTKFTLSAIEQPTNSWPYMLPEPLRNCDSFKSLKEVVLSMGGSILNNIHYIDTSLLTPGRNPVDVEMIIDWEDTYTRPCQAEGALPYYLQVQCSRVEDDRQCPTSCPLIPRYSNGLVKKAVLNDLVKKTPVTIKVPNIKPGSLYIYSRDEYNPILRAFERTIGFIKSLPCYAALFKHGIPAELKESYLLQDGDVVYIPTKGSMDAQVSEFIIPINIKS